MSSPRGAGRSSHVRCGWSRAPSYEPSADFSLLVFALAAESAFGFAAARGFAFGFAGARVFGAAAGSAGLALAGLAVVFAAGLRPFAVISVTSICVSSWRWPLRRL